jgi:4-hydroxyphenylacetate 3-monooxygenase
VGARTGARYLAELAARGREVWLEGRRVTGDIGQHPAFRGIARSLARLYDLQHAAPPTTYRSPSSGEPVGGSFLVPRTPEDLALRHEAMMRWARDTCGMMGRSPDYLNSSLMALAAAADFFASADPRFARNIVAYYEHCRERDLCLTHTLITPQSNRAAGPSGQADPFVAARIVRETDNGVIIRGARMLATLGPVADEILVFPSTVLKASEADAPYAFALAVPSEAPGLRYICRETFDLGRSHFDHPLASRFEEMDAVVVFDDVEVPWERVFLLGHPDHCNRVFAETGAVVHMAHQVVIKNVAKAEFFVGLTSLICEAIGIDGFQHVQEKVAETIVTLETMRAFLCAAEADAAVDAWGVLRPAWAPLNAARNLFPRLYPRLAEIVQQLGASGLMALPTEADFRGPLRADLDRYLQGRAVPAEERVRLFRLAWDAVLSSFGARQVLYERFFFGDPVRMAGALFQSYEERGPLSERVRAFLARGD